jgi:hypothetical protein
MRSTGLVWTTVTVRVTPERTARYTSEETTRPNIEKKLAELLKV